MKKIVLFTMMVLLAVSCSNLDDLALKPQNENFKDITLVDAKTQFNRFILKNHGNTFASIGTSQKFEFKPLWEYATFESFQDGTKAVTIPLDPTVANYPHTILVESDKNIQNEKNCLHSFVTSTSCVQTQQCDYFRTC